MFSTEQTDTRFLFVIETIYPNAFGLTHNVGLNWTAGAGYYASLPSAQIKRWIIPAVGDTNFYR